MAAVWRNGKKITKSKVEDVFYNDKNVTLTATAEFISNNTEEQGTITYKWYKDNNPIEGTTTSTCAIDTTVVGKYVYKVEVENYVNDQCKSEHPSIGEYTLHVRPGTTVQYTNAGYAITVVTSASITTTSITVKTVDTISEYTLPTGAAIRYAMSESSTAPAAGPEGHWQDSATFNNLQQDKEYYFFANVVSPYYVDQISEGVAIRTAVAPTPVTPTPSKSELEAIVNGTSIIVKAVTLGGIDSEKIMLTVTTSAISAPSHAAIEAIPASEWKEFTGAECVFDNLAPGNYRVIAKRPISNGTAYFVKIDFIVPTSTSDEGGDSGDDQTEAKTVSISAISVSTGAGIITVSAVQASGQETNDKIKVAASTNGGITTTTDAALNWVDYDETSGAKITISVTGEYYVYVKVVDSAGTTDKSDLFKDAVSYQVEAASTGV